MQLQNPTLQTIPNTLLANPATSPIFATVLVEYLLERMEEMGVNAERSDLYLRLFRLVFGSVSLFPQENENMLRPHLHQIVNKWVKDKGSGLMLIGNFQVNGICHVSYAALQLFYVVACFVPFNRGRKPQLTLPGIFLNSLGVFLLRIFPRRNFCHCCRNF